MIHPRALHPGAWWLWALGLAVAASRTTNPLLIALIIAVVAVVVAARRGDAPWALSFRIYLLLAALIVVLRVVFRIIFGGGHGEHILFTLPEVPLPEQVAGIRLLGPVAAEQVLAGLYDGMRLAAIVLCVGAANALANPKRMLRSLPSALHGAGTAVVVALSVAPQLVDSLLRVRRARRLRGSQGRGLRALKQIVIPVLVDAMDRSLRLAAAMDSRGYGRGMELPRRTRLLTGALMITGLAGICLGSYGLLDSTAPPALGTPALGAGMVLAALGLGLGGHRVSRTGYRPDRWRGAESLVAGCGVVAALVMFLTARIDPEQFYPTLSPLTWPQLPAMATAGILVAALPAVLAPPPPPSVTAGSPPDPARRSALSGSSATRENPE